MVDFAYYYFDPEQRTVVLRTIQTRFRNLSPYNPAYLAYATTVDIQFHLLWQPICTWNFNAGPMLRKIAHDAIE